MVSTRETTSDDDQASSLATDIETLQSQIDTQAVLIDQLRQRLAQQQTWSLDDTPRATKGSSAVDSAPVTVQNGLADEPQGLPESEPDTDQNVFPLDYFAKYERGFLIRPVNSEQHPYQLKINGWMQFVHHGFARNVETWQDNAGVIRPVRNRNAFDIERGRLIFSGTAIDPNISFFLQLDGDTDGNETVDFFDYWIGGQLTDNFQLQVGKRKVPAGRQWLLSGRDSRLVDRPMANDFFRPDRTTGIFGRGKLFERLYYEWMVGNGFRTANLAPRALDDKFTYAVTNYFDLTNDFGSKIIDFKRASQLQALFGHSFVYSPQSGDGFGLPLGEADFIRLSDGTRLTERGALAADTRVFEFDILFYGLDAAWKWQGWSFNTEYFWRWINNLRADKPLPRSQIWQQGFYAEGGYFLIPQRLDANFRYSEVYGAYGRSSEFAAGVNFYPFRKQNLRLAFDVTLLDGSPLQNTASNINVGDDGTLFRTMLQAEF